MHGFSLLRSAKRQLRRRTPLRALRLYRRLLGRSNDAGKHPLPRLRRDADDQLKHLLKAWTIAQLSRASAPTTVLAYYSLDVKGYHFPGERPWSERWKQLRGATEYKGKRVLELGCNMALLSHFLLKESGVAKTLSVDCDSNILKAAEQVGLAYSVRPTLMRVDLDAPVDWESELAKFRPDVVFALNVLNWVKDKQRLLRFLGNFPEVLFEGHDGVATETARLRDAGFNEIEVVCDTDRRRQLVRCRKAVAAGMHSNLRRSA